MGRSGPGYFNSLNSPRSSASRLSRAQSTGTKSCVTLRKGRGERPLSGAGQEISSVVGQGLRHLWERNTVPRGHRHRGGLNMRGVEHTVYGFKSASWWNPSAEMSPALTSCPERHLSAFKEMDLEQRHPALILPDASRAFPGPRPFPPGEKSSLLFSLEFSASSHDYTFWQMQLTHLRTPADSIQKHQRVYSSLQGFCLIFATRS